MASRYTAAAQYGALGLGAGPVGGSMAMAPGVDTLSSGAAPSTTEARSPARTTEGKGSPLAGMRPLDDPTFWMVASIGAVIGLAAWSQT